MKFNMRCICGKVNQKDVNHYIRGMAFRPSLDRFHLYSAPNHIMAKKIFNSFKISHICPT